ncbi:hypothetical protein ACEPAH_2542 [Sanghuangporus vaninii]
MSVAYTSTSFGAHASSSPSHHHSGSGRHQRQQSASSGSSDTIGGASYADSSAAILPPPATAPSPTRSSSHSNPDRMMRAQYDQIGAFFGARSSSSDDRRGSDRASTNNSTAHGTLPSYDGHTEVESPPTYSKVEEYDAKLNRKLFIYGFLFFPLWIVGIIAPFVRPASDPARDNRSKEDQEADWTNMRKAEIRWAKRCAAALLGFIVVVIIAVVVGVVVANNN